MDKAIFAAIVGVLLSIGQANAVEITVTDNEFQDFIEYTTPLVETSAETGLDKMGWFLTAEKDRASGKLRRTLLMVVMTYDDRSWRGYDRASLKGGQQLNTNRYTNDVIGC
jgi:hypothetical protein